MEAKSRSKIRFFLEPIHLIEFDSQKNPNQRKNLKLHNLHIKVLYKILFFALSIPTILVLSFTVFPSMVFLISIPLVFLISAYLLKLKILFQKISKRIIEPVQQLNPGEFVGQESKGIIHVYIVLKKSMSLYYLKRVNFEDIFTTNHDIDLKNTDYSELKIVKNNNLYKKFMRVVPLSITKGTTHSFKKVG